MRGLIPLLASKCNRMYNDSGRQLFDEPQRKRIDQSNNKLIFCVKKNVLWFLPYQRDTMLLPKKVFPDHSFHNKYLFWRCHDKESVVMPNSLVIGCNLLLLSWMTFFIIFNISVTSGKKLKFTLKWLVNWHHFLISVSLNTLIKIYLTNIYHLLLPASSSQNGHLYFSLFYNYQLYIMLSMTLKWICFEWRTKN